MADLYIESVTTSKSRVGNGVRRLVTGTRDGAIYVCDYITALALEGKLFHVNHGTATTPITFIAYDADRPDFTLDVPPGVAALITRIQVYLEDSAGTDTEIIATTSSNVGGAGTSTVLTPLSTRRNSGVSSACAAYGTHTANITLPANTIEFWRAGHAFADAATQPPRLFEWVYTQGNPQVLVGPAGLQIHISATTTQAAGFIKVSYAEFASSEI
jgi:hypothetical protein